MELRVLRYFLAVAREESITAAAERLNITQPTLSRQLLDLEEELGVKLFNRGRRSRRITLTEAGMFLRKHAEEIVLIADKTEAAFAVSEDVAGDVYVAAKDSIRAEDLWDKPPCFRPLEPKMETEIYFVWEKYQIFSYEVIFCSFIYFCSHRNIRRPVTDVASIDITDTKSGRFR